MPQRRKPASSKQKKAELKVKRAIKRGDLPPDAATSRGPGKRGRGPPHGKQSLAPNIDASRRLESSFVKFSPAFLEEAKRKSSVLPAVRPITADKLLFPLETHSLSHSTTTLGSEPAVTVLKRPKWRYEMSKKEVESNEVGVYKKWLEENDRIIQAWKVDGNTLKDAADSSGNSENPIKESDSPQLAGTPDRMPYAPPLFERNLEVWRQLWRVTEICQVLLILLDSRCPPLHYPQSLDNYLSSFRPPRKVIFVLTKTDITGPKRTLLWKEYLQKLYPAVRVVIAESYTERSGGEGQGKRILKEPHIPVELRRDLVDALKKAHGELCLPPPHIVSDAKRLATWKPSVISFIDWDIVINAKDSDISHERCIPTQSIPDENSVEDFLSVGLIGQPNVGKSSLLNALFGSHKVKASKTPGKTKHFQTLFWSDQIRLVDCPGLCFPGYYDLEMQVLAGILPISQIPAIPSSVHNALQYLPLEKIFALQHPAEKEALVEDKRTWRAGMQPSTKSGSSARTWTAMDLLTAFAEKKGWITAKAGRPDVNRAGNFVLRILAEGQVKWAFYPPDADLGHLSDDDKCNGIWIEGQTDSDYAEDYAYTDDEDEGNNKLSSSASSDGNNNHVEDFDSDKEEEDVQPKISAGTGMFGALNLEDDSDSSESARE